VNKHLCTAFLALLALPLAAQDKGFSVHGGLVAGTDSLAKVTNARTGFTAGVSYDGTIPGAQVTFRSGLTFGSFPGSAKDGLKTSLTLAQLSGDLIVPFCSKAQGILGISLNNWSQSQSGTETEHAVFPVKDAKGLKFGLRVGVEYRLSDRFALEALLQQTELAGRDTDDTATRVGGVNPAWIQIGARYRF